MLTEGIRKVRYGYLYKQKTKLIVFLVYINHINK